MARGICLVSVQFKTLKNLGLRDDDYITVSKVWIDARTTPDVDLVMISRDDIQNPLVVVNREGVQVREIEQNKANNAPPVAACRVQELPELE